MPSGGTALPGARGGSPGAEHGSPRGVPSRGGGDPGGVSRGAAAPETRGGALPRRAVPVPSPVPAPERSRPRPTPSSLPRGEPGLAAPVETVGVTAAPLAPHRWGLRAPLGRAGSRLSQEPPRAPPRPAPPRSGAGKEVPCGGTQPWELQSRGRGLCGVRGWCSCALSAEVSPVRVPALVQRCFLVFREGEAPGR